MSTLKLVSVGNVYAAIVALSPLFPYPHVHSPELVRLVETVEKTGKPVVIATGEAVSEAARCLDGLRATNYVIS